MQLCLVAVGGSDLNNHCPPAHDFSDQRALAEKENLNFLLPGIRAGVRRKRSGGLIFLPI